MEQNLVSDEELIERINKVLKGSKAAQGQGVAEVRLEDPSVEKFHDVYETSEQVIADYIESEALGKHKDLLLENHYLALQLQAEKKKSKELQSKFKLFENSIKYFERLNGQLETIKKAVDDNYDEETDRRREHGTEEKLKMKPKTIHTASNGILTATNVEHMPKEVSDQIAKDISKEEQEEVAFRDAEDFRKLEQGLQIVKDRNAGSDLEAEKVYITKTEKRCLEDIGSLASRTRVPIDDKHQRYFERDRRKFANSIVMPEVQEVDKAESVPSKIILKTKETPVNITSTELDGLKSYLLQLKELIARRETAWARTTERDYTQRVEITRFKNEVSHLRMLCEKRQKDLKERDQIIASKDEEIRELQKRVQGLRNAIVKLEKKDDHLMDTIDGMTSEVLENSQMVQKSYNAMKRQSFIHRSGSNPPEPKPVHSQPSSRGREVRKSKHIGDKSSSKKLKGYESTSNEEDGKSQKGKKPRAFPKSRARHKTDVQPKLKDAHEKVEEKLQKVEDLLQNDVLKGLKKQTGVSRTSTGTRNHQEAPSSMEFPSLKKKTPSNSAIRQEMLTAMTGLHGSLNLRSASFPDPKKNQATATVIANALLAARNANIFNCQYA